MKDYASIWQTVRDELQLSLSVGSFTTWIAPIRFDKKDGSTIRLLVVNSMNQEYIKNHFDTQILELFAKRDPDITKIEYVIKPLPAKEQKPQENTIFTPVSQVISAKENITHSVINKSSSVLERYTFDNFIVGSSNKLAFSAAQLICEKPGVSYNPLFLYGPAGVGKTHLMWAISNYLQAEQAGYKILYITSEEFINEYVNAIRKGEKFTNKYREVDVLLVDDMQFIAGKERTQEEFFHTFNALHQNGKQIVLCSDRPPKEIPTLEERLRSRFEWGMVADISLPDLETRIAIVLDKADSQGIKVDDVVAEYIAKTVESNIRELEGSLTKLVGYCRAHSSELTIDICEKVLGSIPSRQNVTPKSILETTAEHFGISYNEIIGPKRDKQIVLPRQIAMYFMKEELNLSFPKIAANLGKKDHTTIMHGVKKIVLQKSTDTELSDAITELREKIFSLVRV